MDTTIRARLDQHHISSQTLIYRTISGGLLEVMPHWIRGYSGLANPIFNVFMPLDLAGLTDDTLADTAAFFYSRNVHYAIELVHDRFPDGPEFLNRHYYQPLPPQPAMFLGGPPKSVPLNSEVSIERVTTVPSLTAFCTLLNRVFDFPLQDMVKFFPVSHLKDSRIRLFLAFLNEEPVGAGTILCADGVVTIRDMCTIDQYRRRGVATTLVNHMLNDARDDGWDLAMLYSTPQAYSVYNQIGFEIYTQRQWFLPPGIDYEDEGIK